MIKHFDPQRDLCQSGQVAGVYGSGFKAESLARVRARNRTQGPEFEVDSDKELMEIRRMAEHD